MGVYINMALDTFLAHIGPTVSGHPFSLALGTFVLPETSLFSLVWCQTLPLGSRLRAVLDVVPLIEAQVAEVRLRGRPGGLAGGVGEVQDAELGQLLGQVQRPAQSREGADSADGGRGG